MPSTPQRDGISSQPDPLKPVEVPVFSCIAYLSKNPAGGVHARVANLAGLECDAANEREALSKLVPAFKQCVAALTASKTPIPWIEPPSTKAADEQVRLIPVHL
ncbi:MAG TPA: hypothetical protein VMM76_00895 [Pirellulaceae bacterium]|nr:hypothetical protein [Pirellulaceae bacterium]